MAKSLSGTSSDGTLNWVKYVLRRPDQLHQPFRTKVKTGTGTLFSRTGQSTAVFTENMPVFILSTSLHHVVWDPRPMARVRLSHPTSGPSGYVFLSSIQKPVPSKSGITRSRQERILFRHIRDRIDEAFFPVTLVGSNGVVIPDIVDIRYVSQSNQRGHPPYADLVLTTLDGRDLRISCKSSRPMDWFGGGRLSISEISPHLMRLLVKRAIKGSDEDTSSLTIPFDTVVHRNLLLTCIRGTDENGGPNDFIWMGDGKPEVTVDEYGRVRLGVDIFSPESFLDSMKDVHLRIRRRSSTQTFTSDTDESGIPVVFRTEGRLDHPRWEFHAQMA